jgi:3-hydroxypropanoate dehydrogenase
MLTYSHSLRGVKKGRLVLTSALRTRVSRSGRNSSLQGAYFTIAARSLGLDCGPMSGFDNEAVDKEFFPGGQVKSNFLCAIGYGDPAGVFERLPRPTFSEVCSIV